VPSKLRCFVAEVLGRGQQHRGVAVVAAGVHLAGVRLRVRKVLCSVIGSASMSARRPTALVRAAVLDDADHAGLAQPAVDRDAPLGERLGDEVGRASSSKHSSGWAWMSRRTAVIAAASARMESIIFMGVAPRTRSATVRRPCGS
jgi:hypothetical protein